MRSSMRDGRGRGQVLPLRNEARAGAGVVVDRAGATVVPTDGWDLATFSQFISIRLSSCSGLT